VSELYIRAYRIWHVDKTQLNPTQRNCQLEDLPHERFALWSIRPHRDGFVSGTIRNSAIAQLVKALCLAVREVQGSILGTDNLTVRQPSFPGR
jgi:hypothetical protein